eukprot:TRINITY_DN4159_c0_g1_i1.p2 TRINITY_DN4159_c0_g1~~TRINITY_DN4159_c0_g1_i1.p2  ORF type:complete len:190 (-),score=47.06 TRINITY_DN4159_c0_g1_i1:833-1402(-)
MDSTTSVTLSSSYSEVPEEAPLSSSSGSSKDKTKKLSHVSQLKIDEQRALFVNKVKDQFLKAASGMDDFGWDFVQEDQGVTITSASIPGSPIKCTKGESIIKGTANEIYALVSDITNWKRWDSKVTEAKVVKEIDPNNKINYLSYQPVFPVSARDVLFLQSTLQTGPNEKNCSLVKRDRRRLSPQVWSD